MGERVLMAGSAGGGGGPGREEAWRRGSALVSGLVAEVLGRMEALAEEERPAEELDGAAVRVLTEIRGPVGALAEVRVKVPARARPDPALLLRPAPAHLRVQGNKVTLPAS